MIFRTITDDITGATKSIGLFEKSLDNIKNILYSFQTNGIKNTLLNKPLVNIDTKAIDRYNAAIQASVPFEKALDTARRTTNAETVALIESTNGATVSTKTFDAAQKASTISAKAHSAALKVVSIAGNMILFTVIAKGIQLAATAIDNYIHRVEKSRERTDELLDEFKDMNNTLADHRQVVDDLADRYDELSKGVNISTNNNVSLSTEEYEEFLDINKQLANSFPELTEGIDENGISILTLGTNGITAKEQLEELLQTEEDLNNFRIAQGLEESFKGVYTYIEDVKEATENLTDTNEQISILNDFIENGVNLNKDNYFMFSGNINDTATSSYVYAMQSAAEDFFNQLDGYRQEELFGAIGGASGLFSMEQKEMTGAYDLYANLYLLNPEEIKQLELLVSENVHTLNGEIKDIFALQQQELQEQINKGENVWRDFIPNLVSGMKSHQTFKDLEDVDLQNIAIKIVEGLDYSYASAMKAYDPDPYAYIRDNFIVPMSELKDSDKAILKSSFEELLQLDSGDITESNQKEIEKLILNIANLLNKDPLELRGILGFDNVDDLVANYKNTIHDIAKQASGVSDVELRRENGKYSDYKEIYDRIDAFADEYSINTQDEIAAFNQAFEEAEYDIDKAFKLYLQNLTDDNSFTPTISSSVEQIARQLEPQFAKLGDAYSSIFSDDGFHLDVVDNPMLENLRESFAEIDQEIGVTFDTDKINEFFDVLENGTSTVEDIDKAADIAKDAFNDLATAYFYATDTLEQLNEETAQSIKHQLEQMGIANSEEVIDHYLTLAEAESSLIEIQNRLADAQKELAESSNTGEYMSAQRNIEAVYAQMEAFYNEKGATEELRAALFNLQLQQANLDINSINTTASCQQLINLAKYAGLSGEYMERLLDLQDLISLYHSTTNGNMQSAMQPQINAAKQELEDLLNAPLDLTFDFPNGKSSGAGSGAGSAGKDAAQEYLDGFNKECDRLKFLRDNSIITEKEYLDQLRVLYEKYFKDREEYLEEYVKYEREYLNGLKSLYENALSGITGLLDKQMEKIEEERDAKIDALEEEQDARSKALELQKEQLDLQIEEIESQIKVKDAAIDAINDEIDAIKKANDERQRQIDLQKSLYNLERMQNQRTILQYSEDKGMHYVSDTSGIRDAKQSVDDAKMEIEIAGKEKQISLIEDEISLLESRKTLLEDQQTSIDQQIEALDEFYQKLIANTETYYSALIDPIEQYKAQFASIAEIESDAAFGEQLNSLGYSANDILALSSSTLENFKSNYLGILSDIYAGNTQMLDSISMISGFNGENLVGYLSQSQPYIDSLARLDLTSTQTAIDSANSGIYSFADGAVLATANITTMAETTTTLLEGDKKHAGIISSFATMASVLTDANNQIAGITSGMEELDGKTATIKINIETNGDTSLLGSAYASGSAPADSAHLEGTALVSGNWAIQSNEQHALVGEEGFEIIVRNGRYFTVGDRGAELAHIQKGDIVFNHEQSKHLLRYGHISGRGKAYADGSVGGGRFLTSGGAVLRPLQTDSQLYDLMQKFDAYMKRLGGNFKQLVPASFHEYNRQMNELINHKTNNSVVNYRNMQPVVNNEINVTLPNVTNATSAETLLKDLQSLGTKKFQIDW